MFNRSIFWVVIVISIIGMIDSAYLLSLHYTEGESFCDLTPSFSCGDINKSVYSEFLGVPVAIPGFFAYLILFIVSIGILLKWNFQRIYKKWDSELLSKDLFVFVLLGLCFHLYLTWAEIFKLKVICPLCLVSQLMFFGLFFLLLAQVLYAKKTTS